MYWMADVFLGGRDKCRPDHEARRSVVSNRGTVVPVLPWHMFMEVTAYASITWRPRKNRPDRRIRDGEGQVPPRTSATWMTAMAVRRLWSWTETGPHRACWQARCCNTSTHHSEGGGAWLHCAVRRVGRISSAAIAGVHAPDSEPQWTLQASSNRDMHEPHRSILVRSETPLQVNVRNNQRDASHVSRWAHV